MNPSDRERVKELLSQAARLEPQWRKGFIEHAAGGDRAVAAEAMELLRTLDDSEFMRAPTGGGVTLDRAATAVIREGSGSIIGRYKLLQSIGEGGFGTVFMAEQTEPVVRRVALKIIKAGMDTRQVIARFEAERQALALMDHPNIAKVLDAGATDGGRPYFVMELVRGEPITRYCDGERLAVPQRLSLFRDVCGAVQHAHQKGIIHRDIKPTNVLVTIADGKPLAKVIDFGIAKATASRLTDKTLFTEFHQLIGTPEYMSPEQAEATGVDIDTRSDVYALGVLLFELLTGSTPFDAGRLRSVPFSEIQRIIREEDPPRPSLRLKTLASSSSVIRLETPGGRAADSSVMEIARRRRSEPVMLTRALSGDLDWIVMKCLEKDRTRRYETAAALATDIDRYLAFEPVSAMPPGATYRLRKFVRRNRGPVLAAGAIAAVLVAATTVSVVMALRASQALTREEEHRKKAESSERVTKQVAEFQRTQLSGIDVEKMGERLRKAILSDARSSMTRAALPADEIARRQEQLTELLTDVNPTNIALGTLDETIFERAMKAAHEQFKDQPVVKAALLHTLARTLTDLGLLDRAMDALNEALAIQRRTLGNDHAETALSISDMSTLLTLQGKFTEAETFAREAIEACPRVLGQDDKNTLAAINNLALALLYQARLAEAEPYLRDLLERHTRLSGEDDEQTLLILNNMGGLLLESGRLAEAEQHFRESYTRRRRVSGDDDRETFGTLSNLALAIEKQGRPAEAEPLYREAFERSSRTQGEDHSDTLRFMSNLGFLSCTLNKLDVAERLTRGALEGKRRTRGDDNWETLQSVHNLGVVLLAVGQLDEAEHHFRKAAERRRRVLGETHPGAMQSGAALGVLLRVSGRLEEAEVVLKQTLEQRRSTLGADHPDTIDSLVDLADLRFDQGRAAEAETLYREALAGMDTPVALKKPERVAALMGLGRSLVTQDRAGEAESILTAIETSPVLAALPKYRRQWHVRAMVELYESKARTETDAGFDRLAVEWRAKLANADTSTAGP